MVPLRCSVVSFCFSLFKRSSFFLLLLGYGFQKKCLLIALKTIFSLDVFFFLYHHSQVTIVLVVLKSFAFRPVTLPISIILVVELHYQIHLVAHGMLGVHIQAHILVSCAQSVKLPAKLCTMERLGS